jgi:hypothetical protein
MTFWWGAEPLILRMQELVAAGSGVKERRAIDSI